MQALSNLDLVSLRLFEYMKSLIADLRVLEYPISLFGHAVNSSPISSAAFSATIMIPI